MPPDNSQQDAFKKRQSTATARAQRLFRRRIQKKIELAQEMFKKEGFDVVVEEDTLKAEGAPEKNGFPIIIFTLTIVKDLLDPLGLTIFLMVVTKVLSVLIGVVIFAWMTIHFRGRFWRKAGIKVLAKIWTRFFGSALIEALVPFIDILPLNSWFVLWAYNKEKKLVKLFDKVLYEVSHLK